MVYIHTRTLFVVVTIIIFVVVVVIDVLVCFRTLKVKEDLSLFTFHLAQKLSNLIKVGDCLFFKV